ncbi:integrase [Paramagnetospirillum caucaseum]|uniref:Integrase n=1 Tax=Paramagnetospirillum caucaseum TaxID=1244869 RepID=M3A746_9PROT|nr:integrase [Paramagnetospirillum caucaseum]
MPERSLATHYGINLEAVTTWKKSGSVSDLLTGPRGAKLTILTVEEDAIIVAFRR